MSVYRYRHSRTDPDPVIPAIPGDLRIRFTGAIALICFGLGIGWIISTVRIFEGVVTIKDDLEADGDAITDERLTCLIVRMLAHYRDNRRTIRTMILVCTLGGCVFLRARDRKQPQSPVRSHRAVLLSLWIISFSSRPCSSRSGSALASLLSSYYFSRFAKVWERRLHEIEESECALKRTLGLDEA